MVPKFAIWLLLIQAYILKVVTQVQIVPAEIVAYTPGGSAVFLCVTSRAINTGTIRGVQWFIDGVQVNNLQYDTEEFFPSENLGRLQFTNVTLDLDMSVISCAAEFESGSTENSSTQSVLRVQGVLSIGFINLSTTDTLFNLTWPEPFTLDITGEDPDIIGYCVDVINSTSSVIYSECGITETEFYYPLPSDASCTEYVFSVRAINIAGMGEPSTTVYRANAVTEVDNVLPISMPSSRGVNSEFVYRLIMNQPICEAQVKPLVDYYTNDIVNDVVVTSTQENITLSAMGLQFNRRYSATVMVRNSGGNTTLTANISSHPIVTATILETPSGAIILSTEYFRHSRESGALYLFRSSTGDTWALVALNREASDHYTLPFRLQAEDYNVFVYDIEHNGTVLSGEAYPAYTIDNYATSSATNEGKKFITMMSRLDDCTVSTVQCRIDVACTYSSPSGATGFQVIVQRQNQGDKLYVNQTDQTSASVMVEESGTYLVIVLAIVGAAGITDSATAAEYAETVNVDTQGLDSAGSNIGTAVAVPLSVGVILLIVFNIIIVEH